MGALELVRCYYRGIANAQKPLFIPSSTPATQSHRIAPMLQLTVLMALAATAAVVSGASESIQAVASVKGLVSGNLVCWPSLCWPCESLVCSCHAEGGALVLPWAGLPAIRSVLLWRS